MPDYVFLSRLADYGITAEDWPDPWASGFKPEQISFGKEMCNEPHPKDFSVLSSRNKWASEKHAARIRYLIQTPEKLKEPIVIDCQTHAGSILAFPVIIDGWHRLHAHWYLRKEKIAATFGGRLDLWDYLRGITNQIPF